MWFVYVLYNKENKKIYSGITEDLNRRLNEHNQKRGAHFTAKFSGNWIVIYKEVVNTKKEALKRERQLKSYRGREFVQQFIPR